MSKTLHASHHRPSRNSRCQIHLFQVYDSAPRNSTGLHALSSSLPLRDSVDSGNETIVDMIFKSHPIPTVKDKTFVRSFDGSD
ncbi:hypothetical protein TorRG33x02_128260 [Trema orientale]|uniref:Uncharacterized protein n=1 Tax=Trema orientale TaxID=63057 RepID=A0A2P5F0F0_TREOI|nr:hypothetical protein TorRG33x02_128260 [Trema orientale]